MSKDKKVMYGSVYVPQMQENVTRKMSSSGNGSTRIEELEKNIEQLKESMEKSNRDNLDALYNVDEGNFSSSFLKVLASFKSGLKEANVSIKTVADNTKAEFEIISAWKKEAEESISTIGSLAGQNGAAIESIAQWQKTVEDGSIDSIASIKQQADENGASIQNLVSWQSTVDDNIDSLESSMAVLEMIADENGASISQIVEAVGENGEVTAASIVAAVNADESSVKISADRVDIEGFVTFENLEGDGQAAVNGNNISLIAEPDGDSISSLSYRKYRWTDYDPETETADQLMFTIKTIDNEVEQADRARYAAVLQTYDKVWENNNRYAVAMKLISGGDMSFESAGDIFAYAAEKMSLEAGLNVRVKASNRYDTANSNSEIYEDEYSFCTDGIYYGGKKIVSV